MIAIVVMGTGSDLRISTLLHKLLSAKGTVALYSQNTLHIPDAPLDFIICDSMLPPQILDKRCICIFKENSPIPTTMQPSQCSVAIVGSDNTAALNYLAKAGVIGITCGLSQKDTVTLSSTNKEGAVVAIQRTLNSLSGQIIEPVEIPFKLTQSVDRYSLMCAVAVLALCDLPDIAQGYIL